LLDLFFQGSGSLLSHLETSSALVSPLMFFQSFFGTPPAFQTSPPFFAIKRQSGSRTKTHINTHLGEFIIPSTPSGNQAWFAGKSLNYVYRFGTFFVFHDIFPLTNIFPDG
jgi:hypothetical protein